MGLIPKEPSSVGLDPRTSSFMIIGVPKSGKTTLACSAPNTLLIATEMGYRTIPGIHPVPVDTWDKFLAVIREARGETWIERIVVDTFSKLAAMAQTKVCKDLDVSHPADSAYGKGWDRVKTYIMDGMTELMALGKQVILIAHTQEVTRRSSSGEDRTVVTMDLPKAARKFVSAEIQATMYLTLEEDPRTLATIRRLHFKGREDLEIGGRYLPGGEAPESIVIPELPEPGWAVVQDVLMRAFLPSGGEQKARRRVVRRSKTDK